MRSPLSELTAAWLRHRHTRAETDWWAIEEVWARVRDSDDPEDAWAVTLALLAASSPADLEFVGAGPLEDFVERFAPTHIARIEAEARRDPRFFASLGTIWLLRGDTLPDDIIDRVVAASGGAIATRHLSDLPPGPAPGAEHAV